MFKTQTITRLNSIDNLRFLAIVGVVLIHTTTRNLELVNLDITHHPLIFFFNQIPRFAVPLFFLISGFVLELSFQNSNYFTFLKKRLQKILIPYIFWSLIYYFFIYTSHTVSFLVALLYGSSSYQLYFIPSLLILYFIFPFLHRIYNFLFRKPVIIILSLIQISLLYQVYFIKPLTLFYPLSIALLNFLVFILGMFAARHQKQLLTISSKYKYILIFLVLSLGYYIFYEGLSRYLLTQNYLSFYYSWRISVLFYALSLFLLLFSVFQNIVIKISHLSFFVFFIHIVILEYLTPYFGHSGFWLFTSVTTTSFFIAFLAHKIPKLPLLTG